MTYLRLAAVTIGALFLTLPAPKPVHHYVFFGQDRESLTKDSLFLNTPAIEGAQIAYSWRGSSQVKANTISAPSARISHSSHRITRSSSSSSRT